MTPDGTNVLASQKSLKLSEQNLSSITEEIDTIDRLRKFQQKSSAIETIFATVLLVTAGVQITNIMLSNLSGFWMRFGILACWLVILETVLFAILAGRESIMQTIDTEIPYVNRKSN